MRKPILPYLAIIFILMFLFWAPSTTLAAVPTPADAPLPSYTGLTALREANPGADGMIYISDYLDGSVWKIDPTTGAFSRYLYFLSSVGADAQPDADGRIWYTELGTDLGYFNPATCTLGHNCTGKIWNYPKDQLDNQFNLGAIASDPEKHIWAGLLATSSSPLLFELNPVNNGLCSYNLGNYRTYDMRFKGNMLWIGDYAQGRMLSFDLGTDVITAWALPGSPAPGGIDFDADGGIWWAESNTNRLGRLDPLASSNNLRYYSVPGGGQPQSVAWVNGLVFYAGKDGRAGIMDPLNAQATTSTVTPSGVSYTTACQTLNPVNGTDPTGYYESAGTLSFTDLTLTPLEPTAGWQIFTLPAGAELSGSAAAGGRVFIPDPGRKKVVRFSFQPTMRFTYLPLINR